MVLTEMGGGFDERPRTEHDSDDGASSDEQIRGVVIYSRSKRTFIFRSSGQPDIEGRRGIWFNDDGVGRFPNDFPTRRW